MNAEDGEHEISLVEGTMPETPPHLLWIATCQGLQGGVFKKHTTHKSAAAA
jgi:hypothetical protein